MYYQWNGRGIFNFAARYVPADFKNLLQKNNLEIKDIDKFILHQGSKYIVDTLIKRTGIDAGKVIFDIADYGNTVLHLLFQSYLKKYCTTLIINTF